MYNCNEVKLHSNEMQCDYNTATVQQLKQRIYIYM